MEKLIPFCTAVERMGIAKQTGRNWLSQGKFPIPTFKVGRLRFIRESDLNAYFQNIASASVVQLEKTAQESRAEPALHGRRPGKTTGRTS